MATRVDAANELEALKAQLADFALRNAAEVIAKNPRVFLSSDLMKAIEQSALAAVEARLAKEPRPSPEDFAEQVLMQIRPELAAVLQSAAADGPRAARRGQAYAEPASDGLMGELKRNWASVLVAAMLVAAAGGLLGYFGGVAVEHANAQAKADQAALLSSSESVDAPPAQVQAPPARDDGAPKPPAAQPGAATGAVAPKK